MIASALMPRAKARLLETLKAKQLKDKLRQSANYLNLRS